LLQNIHGDEILVFEYSSCFDGAPVGIK